MILDIQSVPFTNVSRADRSHVQSCGKRYHRLHELTQHLKQEDFIFMTETFLRYQFEV